MARRKKGESGMVDRQPLHTTEVIRDGHRANRKRSKPSQFSVYVYKVLKQVHPGLSMTNKAMKVMDDFMHDIYDRLVSEAAGLVKLSRKSTLSASEFHTATRLVLPGELAKHAINDATKAVANFMKSKFIDHECATSHQIKKHVCSEIETATSTEKRPIEIEILHPAPSSSVRVEEPFAYHDPVFEPSEKEGESVNHEVLTKKRKAQEDENDQQEEPFPGVSTPRKSPKRKVPCDEETGDQLHKESANEGAEPTDQNEIPGPLEEPAPPTPPTEEDSDESSNQDIDEENLALSETEDNLNGVAKGDVKEKECVAEMRKQELEIQKNIAPMEETNSASSEVDKSFVSEMSKADSIHEDSIVEQSQKVPTADESTSAKEGASSDKTIASTATDTESVPMDTDTSLESQNVFVTVRVPTNRQGDPMATSDISIFNNAKNDSTSLAQEDSSTQTKNPEADISITENDANPNVSLESQAQTANPSEGTRVTQHSTSSILREAASTTVVTVKSSNVTTTKTVITHERKELVSEWFTESEN